MPQETEISGFEAPGARWGRLGDLWQAPLLLVSVGLFAVAAWLFIDPKPGLSIDLQLAADDQAGAAASLEEYLGHSELKDAEKSWAMGEQAHLMVDRGEFATARQTLEEALRPGVDSVDRGALTYWLGYCQYKLG